MAVFLRQFPALTSGSSVLRYAEKFV